MILLRAIGMGLMATAALFLLTIVGFFVFLITHPGTGWEPTVFFRQMWVKLTYATCFLLATMTFAWKNGR